MKRTLRITLAVTATAALALGTAACSSGSDDDSGDGVQKLLVGTGASPKPYTYQDDDNKLTGYDIELLRAVDKKLDDVEFEFQVAEFPALFAGLDSGRYNVVANNLSATDERREKYDFSDPYIEAQFGIILPKDSKLKVTKIDDLAGKKVYGEAGLNFTKVLEQYNDEHPDDKIDIEYTELDQQTQYKNLAAGQVDFAFNERVVYKGYGEDAGLPLQFQPLDSQYLTDTFGTNLFSAYAFSKRTDNVDKVLEEVNGALAELREDGTMKKLSEQFFDGLDVTPKNEDLDATDSAE